MLTRWNLERFWKRKITWTPWQLHTGMKNFFLISIPSIFFMPCCRLIIDNKRKAEEGSGGAPIVDYKYE